MGPLVLLLLMLCMAALWAFMRFQPSVPPAKVKALSTVNKLFLGLGGVLAVLWVARIYTTYEPSSMTPSLLPGLAASGALGLLLACVVVGLVVRNFVIFPNRWPF